MILDDKVSAKGATVALLEAYGLWVVRCARYALLLGWTLRLDGLACISISFAGLHDFVFFLVR